jgi:hypothetical protein
MREIKFRAWSKYDNSMVSWNQIQNNDFVAFCDPYYILMQYTGLKDNDGKEIYEGDVVTWEDSLAEDYYGGPIVYPEEVVEFKGGSFYPVCMMPETEFEVIGNIHENPELLK